VRLARHLRGFTQKRASDDLGIAQAVFSRLENGLVEADEEIRRKVSQVFSLPEAFFKSTETIYGPPVSVHAMLRGNKSELSARDVDMITAELNIRLMQLRRFMEVVDYSPPSQVPTLDVEQFESPAAIAALVRAHWKMPAGPVKNLTRLLENAGVIVGESSFSGASVSGVTFAAPGRPPIVLVNRSHPADRLRFTLAHELGHLVMHRFPTAGMEDEANQFASAFLLPPHEIEDVFRGRKMSLELLASLKKEWRVSMQSLLMAAQNGGAVTGNQARYLWQQISARGWRTREPASLDFPFDKPTVLPTILKAHTEDMGFNFDELVEISRVGKDDFTEFYGSLGDNSPTRPRLRIV